MKWINVKDKPIPQDGKQYLAVYGDAHIYNFILAFGMIKNSDKIKYWMPLPEIPKELYESI